jgi:hypothetical protein
MHEIVLPAFQTPTFFVAVRLAKHSKAPLKPTPPWRMVGGVRDDTPIADVKDALAQRIRL